MDFYSSQTQLHNPAMLYKAPIGINCIALKLLCIV